MKFEITKKDIHILAYIMPIILGLISIVVPALMDIEMKDIIIRQVIAIGITYAALIIYLYFTRDEDIEFEADLIFILIFEIPVIYVFITGLSLFN